MALPSDVRKVSDLPTTRPISFWAAPKERALPQFENQSLFRWGIAATAHQAAEPELNSLGHPIPSKKLNRPSILPLWKDRWPVTGNLSSSAKSSTRDSPSPDGPSMRR